MGSGWRAATSMGSGRRGTHVANVCSETATEDGRRKSRRWRALGVDGDLGVVAEVAATQRRGVGARADRSGPSSARGWAGISVLGRGDPWAGRGRLQRCSQASLHARL